MTWSTLHVDYTCMSSHEDGGSCMFCDGGLFACAKCNSFEGATTTHCPGEPMGNDRSDRVYAGELDFRDGEWREGECSKFTPAFWSTPEGIAIVEAERAKP